MDFLIVIYWFLTFTGILLFLGGLTYYMQRQTLTENSQLDQMNQQGHRSSTNNRRRNARNANRRKQQQTTNTNSNNNNIKQEEEDGEEQKSVLPEITSENEEKEISKQQSDEEKEKYEDTHETEQILSPPIHIEDEQEPIIAVKQRNKTKTINKPSSNLPLTKEDSISPSKPQASVAPVKQTLPSPSIKDSSNHFKSSRNYQDNNSKQNGHLSSPSFNIYSYSAYNPLPPRFQRQQKEAAYATQRHRRRRGQNQQKRSSFPPDSAARSNDFIPSSFIQQQQEMDDHQTELSANFIQQQQHQQQESSINNGYSSESDILTDSPSIGGDNSHSPLLSTSAGSQSSLQRLELVRSLATSHGLLDELISIFDSISFSSDELELILNKIATRHILDKHDLQRLISSTKNEKTLERILDETCRSQAKILAIELQTEKNRVLELTKSNADMENTIRQLQQQQPNNIVQYQQMIVPYQMQLRRLADENARFQHQLHAYSMLPAALNELKQQQQVLNEQIRQMTIKNSALENEVADSERASKHAAELYKKADAQKQERIEQMIADINKYKKLDKELTNFRQKHNEVEKDLNSKIAEMTKERDEVQANCDQLKEKVQQYEELQIKYDQLTQNQTNNQIEQQLNDLKTENDQLRQNNWTSMQELNKLLNNQQPNQGIISS